MLIEQHVVLNEIPETSVITRGTICLKIPMFTES